MNIYEAMVKGERFKRFDWADYSYAFFDKNGFLRMYYALSGEGNPNCINKTDMIANDWMVVPQTHKKEMTWREARFCNQFSIPDDAKVTIEWTTE